MSLFNRNKEKKFSFRAEVPDADKYIGRTIVIGGKAITIKTLQGNFQRPAFYEINNQHLIGMLRFHAMMEGDTSITEEQFRKFEAMEMSAEKLPPKKVIGMM